jgi:glutathione S-transferase
MSEYTLYIGNRNYSSWSLRGWLACKLAGLQFKEVVIPLDRPETASMLREASPSLRVPVLKHGDLRVWDSLAICEYLAELSPQAGMWPADRAARAHARAISAEVHAGFAELRNNMWMNIRARFPGKGRTPKALADVARVAAIWTEARQNYGAGGPFLFGKFSAADCMYAPVVTRFITWEPPLPPELRPYIDAVWSHPFMADWREKALAEPWTLPDYDRPAD